MSNNNKRMVKIVKRDGSAATFDVSKIQLRIEALSQGMPDINIPEIIGLTAAGVYDGITTSEIDTISAEIAIAKSLNSQSYARLAAALAMSNLHKSTPPCFTQSMELIQQHKGVFTDKVMAFVRKHAAALDAMINHAADYTYNYLSICVMKHGYLYSADEKYYHEATVMAFLKDVTVKGATSIEIIVRNHLVDGTVPNERLPPGMFEKYGDAEAEWVRACDSINKLVAALYLLLPSRVRYLDRPQYALCRMAICLYIDTKFPLDGIRGVYSALSAQKYIHGSSTFVNACTKNQQLLNCFLLSMEDSTDGILRAQNSAAHISRGSGGVGICLDAIRGKGQLIKSTGGQAAGTVRVAKILSETALTWNQGGRRPGSFAEYISSHHSDIIDFLIQGSPTTAEENRTTTLFRGVMMTEHLYGRWKRNEMYSLFSEDTAPGLMYVYDGMRVCSVCGWCPNPAYARYIAAPTAPLCAEHMFVRKDAFTQLYDRYESEYRYTSRIPAAQIVTQICQSKLTSTGPYILNKDAINRRSRQDPSGTITMSNLCAEIVELSTPDSTACCTLASCVLQNFLRDGAFDFEDLIASTKTSIEALDRIIDCNDYPTPETKRNNMYFRPVGLGVQGLADLYRRLRIPYISDAAEQLDMLIHEALYFAALTATCELARTKGPCPAWTDRAIDTTPEWELWREDMTRLQNEFAGVDPRGWKLNDGKVPLIGGHFPITTAMWDELDANVKKYGVRNTYLRANMPTVNTGDILGSSGPSTEPVNFNVFNKTTVGSNKLFKFDDNMIKHLTEIGFWSQQIADAVVSDPFGRLPQIDNAEWTAVREIYLTAYEIPQSQLIRRSGMRQAFIDQTQSFNQFLSVREVQKLRGIIELGFRYGLKTISYYTRMPSADKAGAATVATLPNLSLPSDNTQVCRRDNPDCAACQS